MNTIDNFLNDVATSYGNKTAFKFKKDETLVEKSYLDLNSDTNCFGSYFKHFYGKDNHVGIISPTSYRWFVVYFGLVRYGNVAVTLDYTLNINDICEEIDFADINYLFISEKFSIFKDKYFEKCPKLKEVFIIEEDLEDFLIRSYENKEEIHEEKLAQIIFTSGTTGKNKAVMLSQRGLTNVHNIPESRINGSISVLSLLPVHHISELNFGIMFMLSNGVTICINDSIENFLANMKFYKVNFANVVPLILNKLANLAAVIIKKSNIDVVELEKMTFAQRRKIFKNANEEFFGGNLTELGLGGSAGDVEKIKLLNLIGIRVVQGYGMSETNGVIFSCITVNDIVGSCGQKAIKDLEFRVENDELLVKSTNVMIGYYKNEEENKKVFTNDGFFKTGDLVKFDENKNIYIIGRSKNLIILDNGENVSPEEIEQKISKIPGCMKNVVYGYKNKICVAISGKNLDKEKIETEIEKINDDFPAYKKILKIDITDEEFPVSAKGSILRNEVIKSFAKEQEKAQIKLPINEVEMKFFNKLTEILGKDNFGICDNLFDIGLDSLGVIEFASEFELNIQDIYNKKTIEEIAKNLKKEEKLENDNNVNKLIQINKNIEFKNIKDYYFLTGASGFLGIYILNELVKQGKKVYCLVRNKNKLIESYKVYFNEELPKNVEIFTGDIRYENFALNNNDYLYLKKNVKNVIHAAAIVKHVGDEQTFISVNVEGTKNAINFTKECNATFHYVSSYSVSGFGLTRQNINGIKFDEDILNIKQNYKQNIYVYTKYLAEKEVLEARKDGLKTNIYRVGSLTWDKNGKFQLNEQENGLYNRLLGLKKCKKYCNDNKNLFIDLTPVDECAKAFVNLMQKNTINNIYHLFNPNVIKIEDFAKIYNIKVQGINKKDFEEISKSTNDKNIKFYADYERIFYPLNNNIIDCQNTINILSETGFKWSEIDEKYLKLKIG